MGKQRPSEEGERLCRRNCCSLLLLVLTVVQTSAARQFQDEEAVWNGGRCIPTEAAVASAESDAKFFYYGDRAVPLRIYATSRVTHQLASTVLQILAQEILGYRNISVLHEQNATGAFDAEYLYSQLSNCNESM